MARISLEQHMERMNGLKLRINSYRIVAILLFIATLVIIPTVDNEKIKIPLAVATFVAMLVMLFVAGRLGAVLTMEIYRYAHPTEEIH